MFTGIDLIVIVLVILAFGYATNPPKETKFELEPLTLLVVLVVLGMFIATMS